MREREGGWAEHRTISCSKVLGRPGGAWLVSGVREEGGRGVREEETYGLGVEDMLAHLVLREGSRGGYGELVGGAGAAGEDEEGGES